MKKCYQVLIIILIIHCLSFTEGHSDSEINCQYEKDYPTLKHADKTFKTGNYLCAKQEILDILAIDSIGREIKGEAYITLGILLLENDDINPDSLKYYFYNGLKNYPNYKEILIANNLYPEIVDKVMDSLKKDEEWIIKQENDSLMKICLKYNSEKKRNRFLKITSAIVIAGGGLSSLLIESKANDAYDKYSVAVNPSEINSYWNDYEEKRKIRNILIGVAIGGVLSETIWFMKNPKKPEINCVEVKRKNQKYNFGVSIENEGIKLSLFIPDL